MLRQQAASIQIRATRVEQGFDFEEGRGFVVIKAPVPAP
jgi:hypothetical protein